MSHYTCRYPAFRHGRLLGALNGTGDRERCAEEQEGQGLATGRGGEGVRGMSTNGEDYLDSRDNPEGRAMNRRAGLKVQ